jgi:hypothetical protein
MLYTLANKFITPKTIVIATAIAIVGGVTAVSFIGYQSYLKFQEDARVELVSANASVASALDDFESTASALEQEIGAAELVLEISSGQTLDEAARTDLEKTIVRASASLELARSEAKELAAQVAQTNATFEEQLLWPPNALESAQQLSASTDAVSTDLQAAQEELAAGVQAVVDAQAAWQAEQERLAAEAAAKAAEEAARAQAERLSKPRQIPSGSTLGPTGGATAPTAPPPPPAPAPVIVGFSVDAYLSQFVSPSQYIVQYVPGLCDGFYVCGRVLVSNGSTPVVQLDSDPRVLEIYSTDVGKYVLVHELAHVRQYWFLGQTVGGMIAGSEVYAPETHRGTAAVEYMADCAAMWRLGYGLGGMPYPYTSSCTAEQFAGAAQIW